MLGPRGLRKVVARYRSNTEVPIKTPMQYVATEQHQKKKRSIQGCRTCEHRLSNFRQCLRKAETIDDNMAKSNCSCIENIFNLITATVYTKIGEFEI